MGDEEDDGGDRLKDFLLMRIGISFLRPKRTRQIRTKISIIKEPSKHENLGKIYNLVFICISYQQLSKKKFMCRSLE